MAGEAIGHGATVAFLKNPAAWGGAAAVAGAGHGIEIDRSSMRTDSQLIELMGVTGKKSQMPAVKGNELTAGDIGPMDLYYDGCQAMIAQVGGIAGVPSTPAGATTARMHVIKMADSHKGIYGTLVEKSGAAIREWPFVKMTGYTIECESGQAAKLTLNAFASHINYNQGVSSVANVVASAAPANVVYAIVGGGPFIPPEPTPLRITYTVVGGAVTAFFLTITGLNRHGDVEILVWSKATDALVFNTPANWVSVISVVGSGLIGTIGTDTVQVGSTNGMNNDTTVAAITYPADRALVVFAGMRIYINDQGGAALDATVVKGIRRLRLAQTLNLKQSVTTKGRRITDEPLSEGFSNTELSFGFERWSTVTGDELNHDLLKDYLRKTKKKVKIEWLGPIIETVTNVSFQYRLTAYLNNVVFTDGQPAFSGPGQMALDIAGRAFRATAIPTGFPTGYTDPCTLELVNTNVADALA